MMYLRNVILAGLLATMTGWWPDAALAQSKPRAKPHRYLELGTAALAYHGSFQPNGYALSGQMFSASLQTLSERRITTRIFAGIGHVSGGDPSVRPISEDIRPNKTFRTQLITAGLDLQVNVLRHPRYRLYISQGIGLFRFVPRDAEGRELSNLRSSRARDESYSGNTVHLPTGIGGCYVLQNGYSLSAHWSLLNPQTNYLDNAHNLVNPGTADNLMALRIGVLIPLENRKNRYKPSVDWRKVNP